MFALFLSLVESKNFFRVFPNSKLMCSVFKSIDSYTKTLNSFILILAKTSLLLPQHGKLLSPRAADNLLSLRKVSNRIIVAEFNSNPKTTFVTCYSPTNVSEQVDIDNFYSILSHTIHSIPAHNFLILAGDFNAQLGVDNVKFSYHESTNRNGNKLFDFMFQHQLVATNTLFMKSANKLWTFQHPSGNKSQIDYVLDSVRNAQSYFSFSSVGSDHRVVSAHICLSLRSSKKSKPNPLCLHC